MPPKNKGAASAAKPANSPQEAIGQSQTVHERARQLYELTQPPYEKEREELGLHALATVEKTAYANWLCTSADTLGSLSKKAQKELWKQVNDLGRPLRRNQLWKPTPEQWGRDRHDRLVGDLSLAEFERRADKQDKLSCLTSLSNSFSVRRALAAKGLVDARTGEKVVLTAEDIGAERARRQEMAFLKNQLYGEKMGPYATDPDWDDVVPIPQMEPENALAAIAYPDEYAESMSYLRAVMAAGEYSPRCLKLTEHIISMNPAHYTVWLYRFSIVQHLEVPVLDEIAWLNEVAFENHKNYQIWHHRQLLLDHYYPMIEGSPGEMARFVKTEREFIMDMLSEDAKNYHVWSYRQSLVRKLGAWDEDELASISGMIKNDVRNNSAWSHRFFIVFSNPSHTTPDSPATEHDPKVPTDIVDREIEFAKEKITLAPQNQSPWNYLYGVLVKGGRKLGDVREFAEQYVQGLGEETEDVRSSHALDLLSSIYAESGDVEKADLCLRRLGERWDRIRGGYWEWKRKSLRAAK